MIPLAFRIRRSEECGRATPPPVSPPTSPSDFALAVPPCVALPERKEPVPDELAEWFAREVQPHEETLRSFLRHRFPTIGDVDDIVQETYARLCRERKAGKVFEAKSYLFPVARNLAIDLFRRNKVVAVGGLGVIESLGVLAEKADPAEQAAEADELQLLDAAMATLPERCREIFSLRRIQGLSYDEISVRLGITESTVDAQLCIALLKCRQYFLAHGVERGKLRMLNAVPLPRRKR